MTENKSQNPISVIIIDFDSSVAHKVSNALFHNSVKKDDMKQPFKDSLGRDNNVLKKESHHTHILQIKGFDAFSSTYSNLISTINEFADEHDGIDAIIVCKPTGRLNKSGAKNEKHLFETLPKEIKENKVIVYVDSAQGINDVSKWLESEREKGADHGYENQCQGRLVPGTFLSHSIDAIEKAYFPQRIQTLAALNHYIEMTSSYKMKFHMSGGKASRFSLISFGLSGAMAAILSAMSFTPLTCLVVGAGVLGMMYAGQHVLKRSLSKSSIKSENQSRKTKTTMNDEAAEIPFSDSKAITFAYQANQATSEQPSPSNEVDDKPWRSPILGL